MSQSDYIKYKKTSAILNNNEFPPLLEQGVYLNNEAYYIENQNNIHITPNQLISPTCVRVYGLELNRNRYSKTITNSKNLHCFIKSNYKVPNVVMTQPIIKSKPVHKECIHVDETLYCNKNNYLKPITYVKDIKYKKFAPLKEINTKYERIRTPSVR
jgi:hypothetical protein